MRFLPEDEVIEKLAAMLIGADLFDLGIPEEQRFRKVANELTVAFSRPCHLFRVKITEDKGYLTSLLLSACETVLTRYGLHPLAIFPDGELFEGEKLPEQDLSKEIAIEWQKKIDRVFGGNIEQLVRPTKDGIKVDPQAIQQNPDEALICILALLEKKKAGIKLDKIQQDVNKYAESAGKDAVKTAEAIGLLPISNADEFAISEGLKAAYLSYREANISTQDAWNRIAKKIGLSPEQRESLEPFNAQYGRCLFAAKSATLGLEGIKAALQESFQLRQNSNTEISEEMISAVSRMLNLPLINPRLGQEELNFYINANPKQRCSLGTTSGQVIELMSSNMPPETKVQSFSNRLPGGISAEPKRQAEMIASLAYQLMAVGANFPSASKQEPLYLHFALPIGSSPDLLRIWQQFLRDKADTNADGGTVTVDELKLYKEKLIEFKPNKIVGFAFPKRPEFIHSTVIIPLMWGDVTTSVALLKSLRLALELSLSFEIGFPFILSGNLEIETGNGFYGQVEGIPSSLQPIVGDGQYSRSQAQEILNRLRCIGELAVKVASLQKKDDCLYGLACAVRRPIELYYVLLRWLLREHDEPNLEYFWGQIAKPLNNLLESFMKDENDLLTQYLREAAQIAENAKLRGSSLRRTSQVEPFTEFITAIRSRKSHLSWDVIFGALVQNYHTRLDRIREHGVGATKYEHIKQYYEVLRKMFEEVYHSRPEKLLADKKTLEAAYLFFLQEVRQQLKSKAETESTAVIVNEK